MANSLVKNNKKTGITGYLTQEAVRTQISNVIGEKNRERFTASIVSAVTVNPALSSCTNSSILSGALLGESLKLSPSPQLGNYYLVPYNDREKGKVAQFQMGYKGYIQLAIRSGQYKKLNVIAIKEGELEYFDPLNEEIKVNIMVEDWDKREEAKTIGYYAMFELVNGFRKAIYWSKAQMDSHAKKYSTGYANDLRKGTKYTFWSKDFDGMAYKTMLRQLISKWGVMSIELQNAFVGDMAVINDDGTQDYVDNKNIIDVGTPSNDTQQEEPEKVEGEVVEKDNSVAGALFS